MVAVRLLGQLQVEVDDATSTVSAPLQRAVLASLALARGRVVTMDQLVDGLWADPPENAANAVQHYVSALRARVGRDRVATVGRGYRLDVGPDDVDVDRFAAATSEARRCHRAGRLAAASTHLSAAIGLWRGTALADLPDCPFVAPARTALAEALLEAQVLQLAVENDLGHAAAMVARAETLAAEHPLDERVSVQLMRALAGSGRTADALEVYEQMRTRLVEELGVDPGEQLQAAQAAILSQDPALVAATDPALLASTIPKPAEKLLGREQALAEVEDLLQDPDVSIVTLAGPGGIGKTRLAVELALRASPTREVIYVPLDAVPDAELVVPAIAAALQVQMSPDDDPVKHLAGVLRGRDLLLVLDNLEHVIGSAPDLARLVTSSFGLALLLTSRESLRVAGEHLYRLSPLATSNVSSLEAAGTTGGVGASGELGELGEVPAAIELFYQRAEAASPEFRRESDPRAVAGICEQLDGLPLAIELAAARTNVLPPGLLLQRLSQRLSLLTAGPRDAPERQRSLRACLEWSVDLLNEDERRLFAAVSVFAGGATVRSMEEVCGELLPDVDILAIIDSLVAKSLLRPAADRSGTRLAMLETIREYAAELLRSSGDADDAALAHARHFHDLLRPDENRAIQPPRNATELAFWSAELPNARVALHTLTGANQPQMRADLVVGLGQLWDILGHLTEAEAQALELGEDPEVSPARRVELMELAALGAERRGDLGTAERRALEALRMLAELDVRDTGLQSRLHALLTVVAFFVGDAKQQRRHSEAAISLARQRGDAELIAAVSMLPGIGWEEGLAQIEAALATVRAHGNQRLEIIMLANASEFALCSKDPADLARAEEWGRSAYQVGVDYGDLTFQLLGLGNAGAALLLMGMPEDAARDLRLSLALARRVGDVRTQVENLVRLAGAEAAQGHTDTAAALYRSWRMLNETTEEDVSESNQRIIDNYLADIATPPTAPRTLVEQVSLPDAVALALGEQVGLTSYAPESAVSSGG